MTSFFNKCHRICNSLFRILSTGLFLLLCFLSASITHVILYLSYLFAYFLIAFIIARCTAHYSSFIADFFPGTATFANLLCYVSTHLSLLAFSYSLDATVFWQISALINPWNTAGTKRFRIGSTSSTSSNIFS